MYELKLRLLDPQQARQVTTFLRTHPNYGHFEVSQGQYDSIGGTDDKNDTNVHIRTTDMNLLHKALDEHFYPRNDNWRHYQQNG